MKGLLKEKDGYATRTRYVEDSSEGTKTALETIIDISKVSKEIPRTIQGGTEVISQESTEKLLPRRIK